MEGNICILRLVFCTSYAPLKKQNQNPHSARNQEIRLLIIRESFITSNEPKIEALRIRCVRFTCRKFPKYIIADWVTALIPLT